MKRWISMLLAVLMLLSALPNVVLADFVPAAETTAAEPEVVSDEAPETDPMENWGYEVTVSDALYYTIEDGALLCYEMGARPVTVAENVVWVILRDDTVYYAKLDGNNTDLYRKQLPNGSFAPFTRLYCPIDAFDVAEGFVYYSYNGEVFKLNVESGAEECVPMASTFKGFYAENGKIIRINREVSSNNIEKKHSDSALFEAVLTKTGRISTAKYFYYNFNGNASIPIYQVDGSDIVKAYIVTITKGSKIVIGAYKMKDSNGNIFWDFRCDGINKPNGTQVKWNCLIKDSDLKKYFSDQAPSNAGEYEIPHTGYNDPILDNVASVKVTEQRPLDNSSAGTYTNTVSEEEANIAQYEKPSFSARIVNWIKSAWKSIKDFFGLHDAASTRTIVVTVLGTVTNSEGQWYLLSGNTYVSKPQFDKCYERMPQQTSDSVSSSISFVGIGAPSATVKKAPFSLSGTIKSTCNISEITGRVVSVNTGTATLSKTVWPGTTTYSILNSALDCGIKFQNLSVGSTYYLEYVVTDITGNQRSWRSSNFTVIEDVVAPTPSTYVESTEYGQRLVMSCSDGGALLHMTFNGGEHSGYGQISYDFTSPGTYNTQTWTTKSSAVSGSVYNTISVSKMNAPVIGDAEYRKNQNYATVTLSGDGEIYYTLDGSVPTKGSARYTGPIQLTGSATVNAISTQWGCANSDVATKTVTVTTPDAPAIKLTTKDKVAQGQSVGVSWEPTARATAYTAYLLRNGAEAQRVDTEGTMAVFTLNDRSETENFQYTVKVVAKNFKGDSASSNAVTVWGMHPVTVTFVDRIIRSGELTETKLATVKQHMNERLGNGAGDTLEGNILSVQRVEYDQKPSKPATPSKVGFTFSGWTAGLFEAATADKTVYGEFDINTYQVTFYDIENLDERGKQLDTKTYLYSDEAVFPENYQIPEGYVFGGWNIDNAHSTGFDLTFIDGNIIADASYCWGKPELPVWIRIDSLVRRDDSYKVTVSTKNNPYDRTQGRVIVALYTSEGRNVYTQICEQDLPLGTPRDWTAEPEITLLYNGKIAYAKAVVVAANGDKTGGALSEATECRTITYAPDSSFWTKWSDYEPTPVYSSDPSCQVRTKTEYRYRDKQTNKTNDTKTLSGWNYDYTVPSTGGWIDNGTNWVGAENSDYRLREVKEERHETYKTQWQYSRYVYLDRGKVQPYRSRDYTYLEYTGWHDYPLRFEHYAAFVEGYYASYNPYWSQQAINDGIATRDRNWYNEETRTVVASVYYTYQYRDTYYTHYFWKWGSWSNWSDSVRNQNNREVQSRTVYSYRTTTTDANEQEVQTVFSETLSGRLPNVETEYVTEAVYAQGKNALVSGPYYLKDASAENESEKYVLVSDSTRDAVEYRYGRYTNGAYAMPCVTAAEELYGGEWTLEWTDWSETAADVSEDEYTCEQTQEHVHEYAEHGDGVDTWKAYTLDGETYCFMESRTVTKPVTYPDTTLYYKVQKSLEGKVATVMVYKKTNSDPTQAQLEYVDQIEIGPLNSYSFTANTKEALSYDNTGDFIVTLALEGYPRLVNLGVIKAPLPQCKVTFYTSENEEYRTVTVDQGGSVDLSLIDPPTRQGYRFVKWDRSVVNVTNESLSVNAVWAPETYAVVFVDHVHETAELRELLYGDPIPSPEVEPVDGKTFLGWKADGENPATTVSGNMVITADWATDEYSVRFIDLDGKIVKEQSVKYGEAATPPANFEKDGKTYSWDLTGGTWWNVTEDMVIRPHNDTPAPVAAPVINASTEDVGGAFYAELSASGEDAKVFYTLDCEITLSDAVQYVNLTSGSLQENEDSQAAQTAEIQLMEAEEQPEEYMDDDGYYEYSPTDFIQEYTEPIRITEGTVVYAFTVNADGDISPIAVFEYGYDNSEDAGIIENTYEIDPDCPQITLPSLTVKPGETVEVPVTIKNNSGLTNLSIVLGYNEDELTLVKTENGNVFRNSEFSAETREDGSCKFTWLTGAVNDTDGTLLTLTFKAGETAGKQKLELWVDEAASPEEEESPFATQDGVIQSVSETVPAGDANGDGVVNFADAILVLRYDIGYAALSALQRTVADVNGDGETDFADAIKILRYDAGLISSLN